MLENFTHFGHAYGVLLFVQGKSQELIGIRGFHFIPLTDIVV